MPGGLPITSTLRPGRVPLVWIGVAIALVAGACGARVAPYLGPSGVAATPAAGSPPAGEAQVAQPSGGATAVPVTSGAPGGRAGAPGPSTTGGHQAAGGAGSPPAGFDFDPSAEAAACPASNDNRASDVGVTPTSITLGNVSGLTGVLPNNFEQGPQAVQALFSAINAHGGICGRQLKVTVEDDGQDASKNAAAIADLIPRVFAFVGSTSDADNGGVQEMVNAGIPDIGFSINANRGQSNVYWSASGSTLVERGGHSWFYDTLQQGLAKFGPAPKRLAILAYNIPISADAAKQWDFLWSHENTAICFTDFSISPATASLDQDVLQMKANGCDGVYTTLDVTGNAKLLQAMKRQRFDPAFKGSTFATYSTTQITVAGVDAAEGFQSTIPFLPFDDSNPVMQRYVSQLATYQPGKAPSSFGIHAWAAGQMLVYALLAAGRNPTRAKVVATLAGLNDWDTGGVLSPVTPRDRNPNGACVVEMIVHNGVFVRAWPPQGLYCGDRRLVPTS